MIITAVFRFKRSETFTQFGWSFLHFASRREFASNALDRLCYILDRSSRRGSVASAANKITQSNKISSLERVSRRLAEEYHYLPVLGKLASEEENSRGDVLRLLSKDLATSHDQILGVARKYTDDASDAGPSNRREVLAKKLLDVCTPQYQRLFDKILSDNTRLGLSFFLELRQDLLLFMKIQHDEEMRSQLKQLNESLRSLLSTWFSPETLTIRRLTFEATSAAIIEKIAKKEAVHPMKSLDDLRVRLGKDKRVYCAFHPLLSDEPLIFVHVALRPFQPSSMGDVLNTLDIKLPTVAAFYSISATQPGLGGVALGEVLIKKATELIKSELPSISTFITLSPIPKFRSWLLEKLTHSIEQNIFSDSSILSEKDLKILMSLFGYDCSKEAVICFKKHIADPWALMSSYSDALEPVLMRLAARYLLVEKHRKRPLDAVGRFHIQNGAEVYRLNYIADTSRKGLHNSLGLMVNYRYNPSTLVTNREQYALDFTIPKNEQVEKYL